MALHLTSAVSIRESSFSRSECLELARTIERRFTVLTDRDGNEIGSLPREMIVAALRAYANG
jgi:hypothetical protein